jgi:hypothetical protein
MAQHIPDEILYDVRLLERHIQRGVLTREQVDKRRQESPDMTEQADILDLEQLATSRGNAVKRSST